MSQNKIQNIFAPDLKVIKSHLSFLFSGIPAQYSNGFIEISRLNNSKYFPVTDIDSAATQAFEWNTAGDNIYTTAAILVPDINERIQSRGGRARAEDFYAANAAWVDLDTIESTDALKETYKDAPPNYYVVTGRNPNLRSHLWWSLETLCTDKAKLESVNKGLIKALGGDPGTHNCTRLMRVAGCVAWPKKEGRITEAVEGRSTSWMPPHALETLAATYPDEKPLPQNLSITEQPSSLNINTDGFSRQDVENMLRHISPDSTYYDWLSIGMAIKDHGMPFAIFDSWSAGGSSYPGSIELRKKWDSFKGRGTTIGTIYYHAKNGGFDPNNYRQKNTHNTHNTYNTNNSEEFDPSTGEFKEQPKAKAQSLFYIPGRDIKYNQDDASLIKDVLGQSELSVIYGESNCGKTFFMTDLAFHVARGIDWRGHRTSQGGVMYAALEGAKGLSGRFEAYCKKHSIDKNIPFAMMPCALDFYSESTNISEFIDLIKSAQDDIGDPKLVVIDTLARALAGGDENSGQDMGKLVYYADMIRRETEAHLSFVHHSGKNKALGARGHSSLRAAVDTEIEISRDENAEYSVVKFVKQREMEMIGDKAFSLERVVIGLNSFTEEISSCVVIDAVVDDAPKERAQSAKERFVHEAIIQAVDLYGKDRTPYKDGPTLKTVTFDQLAEVLQEMGYDKMYNKDGESNVVRSTKAVRVSLRDKNLIGFNAGGVWLLTH